MRVWVLKSLMLALLAGTVAMALPQSAEACTTNACVKEP